MNMRQIESRDILEVFNEQRDCIYKGEHYSVRDNGAVCRHKSPNSKRNRPLDDIWTFGKKDSKTGYMFISSHRVHIIVAVAFLGEKDSTYVVDHIDTNRCNNRVKNLRWLTKLENALNNPATLKKITFLCGGNIQRFLDDPSCLRDLAGTNQDVMWMRTVTSEEATNAYNHVMSWASKPSQHFSGSDKSDGIGEWIYKKPKVYDYNNQESEPSLNSDLQDYDSLTPNAKQRDWKTPTLFPLCPEGKENLSLDSYRANLHVGTIVSQNKYSTQYIDEFKVYNDKLFIRTHANDGVKRFSMLTISIERGYFIHQGTTFFQENSAKKEFSISIGKEWTGPEVIDDFC